MMTSLRSKTSASVAGTKSRSPAYRLPVLMFLVSSPFGVAQVVQPAPPPSGEVVELSPFTVNTTSDVGYVAENTLAGSRLNTRLRDTASSVAVFTKEFLDDLAI